MINGSRDTNQGTLLFNSIISVFQTKLGLAKVATSYDTYTVSVVGAVFYNLKYWGLLLYILASGIFASIIGFIAKKKITNTLSTYFIILGFATILASPIMFLFNTSYTYYLVLDIAVISTINQFRIKSRL